MIGITERGDAALDYSWMSWVALGNAAILITKDPMKLSNHVTSAMNVIVHCTITGWGSTTLEPNVPTPENALQGLKRIQQIIGFERVVLRVDPIITELPERSLKIISMLQHAVARVRISFLDMYSHVKVRFSAVGITLQQQSLHAPIEQRRQLLDKITVICPDVEICGEPDLCCTGCISRRDLDTLKIPIGTSALSKQRQSCLCLKAKHELLSNKAQCYHKCTYCYWK
jgi:DNA repair photolyase